jgi:hypothetical protein
LLTKRQVKTLHSSFEAEVRQNFPVRVLDETAGNLRSCVGLTIARFRTHRGGIADGPSVLRDLELAEGEGFEPPVPFRVQWFSRPPPSTTRPSLRTAILFGNRGLHVATPIVIPTADGGRSWSRADHDRRGNGGSAHEDRGLLRFGKRRGGGEAVVPRWALTAPARQVRSTSHDEERVSWFLAPLRNVRCKSAPRFLPEIPGAERRNAGNLADRLRVRQERVAGRRTGSRRNGFRKHAGKPINSFNRAGRWLARSRH